MLLLRPTRIALLLIVGFIAGACSAFGYTYVQIGVNSNFLVVNDRVLFAQADGSLTVLSLENGSVLARLKDRNYSGKLQLIGGNILSLNYGTISCLDADTLSLRWETPFHYDPSVIDDTLVSYDGYGLVQCRNLQSGSIEWTYELPGALDVIAEAGKVLIHRADTFDEKSTPATVLLDQTTGRELFRKSPTTNEHWPNVFFDGTNIFVLKGRIVDKRSNSDLEEMLVWSLDGSQIETLSLPTERDQYSYHSSPFELGGRTFWNRRVYPDSDHLPADRMGRTVRGPVIGTNQYSRTVYLLDGEIRIALIRERDRSNPLTLEIETPMKSFTGSLPYLSEGRISSLYATNHWLLLGTDLGHVECLDTRTGRSVWLYVFATMRQTMSYSSHGMPPMMSAAAETFRRENSQLPLRGFTLVNEANDSTRIILDPEPVTPFDHLAVYLVVAWGGVLLPIVGLIWTYRFRLRGPTFVTFNAGCLFGIAIFCLYFFGRVSLGSAVGLRFSIFACLIVGVLYAIKAFRSGQRIRGILWILFFLANGYLVLPVFLHL